MGAAALLARLSNALADRRNIQHELITELLRFLCWPRCAWSSRLPSVLARLFFKRDLFHRPIVPLLF
jgi:hypothetical protein